MRSSRIPAVLALGLGLLLAAESGAGVFASRREALEQAFPDADRIETRTFLLDDAQARAIESKAQAALDSRLLTVHTARRGDAVLGYALIDVHTVRTRPAALLVVLTPEGRVRTTRLLAFYEPPEYAPPERWLRLFDDRALEPSLRLGGEIHGIAGSTLSSRAFAASVRRSLAAFEVLLAPGPAGPVAAARPDPAPEVARPGAAGGR